MSIIKIKEKLQENKGKEIRFKFNGSRNQKEEFIGIVDNIYSSIFTIKINKEVPIIKSFSYSDILMENLEVYIDE